jgi:hypothetical protein
VRENTHTHTHIYISIRSIRIYKILHTHMLQLYMYMCGNKHLASPCGWSVSAAFRFSVRKRLKWSWRPKVGQGDLDRHRIWVLVG